MCVCVCVYKYVCVEGFSYSLLRRGYSVRKVRARNFIYVESACNMRNMLWFFSFRSLTTAV